jgi:hypothetical protein
MNQPAATITPPPTVPGLRVEVLKVGTFRDLHGRDIPVTREDLTELAASYDPARYRAPVVIGHPRIEDCAWGVHERFEVEGDSLFAVEGRVDAQFAAFRDAGRFAERSLSFFLPDHPNNPTPGKKHVKHVGWLGAVPPAVPGLERLQGRDRVAALSAYDPNDQHVVALSMRNDRRWGFGTSASLFRRVRDWMIEQFGVEKADMVVPSWEIDSLREAAAPDPESDAPAYFSQPAPAATPAPVHQGPAMTQPNPQTVDLAAQQAALAEREARVAAQEQQIAATTAAAARTSAVEFADSLVTDGRLLPRNKSRVVELMLALPATQAVAFSGDDGSQQSKPAVEIFRELMLSLPKQIDFAVKSDTPVAGEAGAVVDFAAAPGAEVDPAGLAIHAKALQYMQRNTGATYLQAVKACGG